ncbi:MAG: heparinase II/III family protein [Minwuiales bacterium]|nr:heparinase II/III family protein [Minwuiales bacterium]
MSALAKQPDTSAIGQAAANLLFKSRLYRMSLSGRHPVQLAVKPEDPWPGDPATADDLFRGTFRFADADVVLPNQSPWTVTPPNDGWWEAMHGFVWLRDFAAAGGEAAQRHARALVKAWLDHWSDYDADVWRSDVLGRRMISWISQGRFLLDDAEPMFRSSALDSLARQARHLTRTVRMCPSGSPRLTAAAGLVFSGAALPDGAGRLKRGLKVLGEEIDRQVLPDGGHISRNPLVHHQVLRDLIAVRCCLEACKTPIPESLQAAIARMAPMLRFFRHSDRGLALFNGANQADPAALDLTLAKSDCGDQPPASATNTGFERIANGATLLLIETGPGDNEANKTGHAGLLSFEASADGERLIVNCGAPADTGDEWAQALAATAAHSTVTVGERNSAEVKPGRGIGHPPTSDRCERNEADGQVWIEAAHHGYEQPFALTHRRRLYLDETGIDLRGEDVLRSTNLRKSDGVPFAARFHLHPDVTASLLGEGTGALLRTPSGAGWQFKAAGGAVTMQESVYLGIPGRKRRSEQIVVSGRCDGKETKINWVLSQVAH